MEVRDTSFLGRGWSFPPSFNRITASVDMVSAAEDIRQSLFILLHTEPGERIMVPEYGCATRQFLFETTDTTTLRHMQDVIEIAILNYEARIQLHAVSINADSLLDGILLVEIDYSIRTINSRHNVVFPFYKIEATLL